MYQFRIRLYGANNLEQASFRSLLNIAESKLDDHWEITSSALADVAIYDMQSEVGRTEFHRHHQGLNVALITDKTQSVGAATTLVKPMRVKKLTELLNRLGKEVRFNKNAAKSLATQTNATETPKKEGLFSSLSKHLIGSSGPALALPKLELSVTKPISNPPHTILEPNKLHQWLRSIAKNAIEQRALALYTNLASLNQTEIRVETKIALLEHYRQATIELITPTDRTFLQLNTLSNSALPVLMSELAMGYKSLLMSNYRHEKHPMSNPLTLLYIIRTAEFFNLAILSAYCRYQTPPDNMALEYHRLYRYCEAADMLTNCAQSAIATTEKPFIHYYTHSIILAHTNPYSLTIEKILRLYDVISHMTEFILIQDKLPTQYDGIISIIHEADQYSPRPLQYTAESILQQETTRFVNLDKLVAFIGELIVTPEKRPSYIESSDIQLLQLLSTRFKQVPIQDALQPPSAEPQLIAVTTDFLSIADALLTPDERPSDSWYFIKQQQETLYIQRYSAYEKAIQAGQLILIYQQERTILASILWVYTDHSHTMHLAAQLITQQPQFATIVDNQTQQSYRAIRYPLIDNASTVELITDNQQSLGKAIEYQLHSQNNTTTFTIDKTISHHTDYQHHHVTLTTN